MWVLALIFDVFIAAISGFDIASREDLKNGNDRDLLKKPSDKYVC
jgi:hypothetical protein